MLRIVDSDIQRLLHIIMKMMVRTLGEDEDNEDDNFDYDNDENTWDI